MPHYGIVCPQDAGGFFPICALGQELVRRGHRVTVLADSGCASLAKLVDLPFHPLQLDEELWRPPYLKQASFEIVGAGWVIDHRASFEWLAETILRRLPGALRELNVDGVLTHQNVAAAGTSAERVGVPFVTVCSAMIWNQEAGVPPFFTPWPYAEGPRARLRNQLGYAGWNWFMRPTLNTINRYRREWRLRPFARIDDMYSPLAQISQLCPELDFPRRELRPNFHYIGSLSTTRQLSTDHDFPWDRLDGRRLIFASLGTAADPANLPVFRAILAACAGLDAQVVLGLGRWHDEYEYTKDTLDSIPNNALVVDFAPQLALLDRATLLITHAGVNTVLEALCRGVPMIALPRNADHPGMGARLAHAGAGLLGSFRDSSPARIRDMIRRVLDEDSFRMRARELQQSLIAAGGLSRAADIAEEALKSRRPRQAHTSPQSVGSASG